MASKESGTLKMLHYQYASRWQCKGQKYETKQTLCWWWVESVLPR